MSLACGDWDWNAVFFFVPPPSRDTFYVSFSSISQALSCLLHTINRGIEGKISVVEDIILLSQPQLSQDTVICDKKICPWVHGQGSLRQNWKSPPNYVPVRLPAPTGGIRDGNDMPEFPDFVQVVEELVRERLRYAPLPTLSDDSEGVFSFRVFTLGKCILRPKTPLDWTNCMEQVQN